MSDIQSLVQQFNAQGFLLLKQALGPEEVERVREAVLRVFQNGATEYGPNVCVRMFEHGQVFEDLIDHPAIVDVMEGILGEDCHLIAQNALYTRAGQSVAAFFHADDVVRFPIPEGVEMDPRIVMPCYVVNMNIFLTEVDELSGPTQIVPGSHRSGRMPQDSDMAEDGLPSYKGQRAISVAASPGDALMWHDQLWHRGAPSIREGSERIVQQGSYGRRWVAQRFFPFVNYQIPPHVVERASERRRRLLGLHGRGAYG